MFDSYPSDKLSEMQPSYGDSGISDIDITNKGDK